MVIIQVKADGIDAVNAFLDSKRRRLGDLSPYFKAISSDFFKSNEPLMFRGSPGKYPDLKESTKRAKQRRFGKYYPVLVATGRLRDSLSSESNPESVEIIGKSSMEIGTSVPYAKYHQFGAPGRNLAKRPFLLIDIDRRLLRWKRILEAAIVAD